MNELYHHGIKGMHWGIRRFQNPDGTLTAAGKRRERSAIRAEERAFRKEAKQQRIHNAQNSAALSDEELTSQILRLQREKQLKDLTRQSVTPGRNHVKDLMVRYGDQAVTAAVTTAITIGITKNMNKRFDPKESDYDRLKREWDDKGRLADEGYPVGPKAYDRVDGRWVKRNTEDGSGGKRKPRN